MGGRWLSRPLEPVKDLQRMEVGRQPVSVAGRRQVLGGAGPPLAGLAV